MRVPDRDAPDGDYLRSVALGYRLSQVLYVFAELDLAGRLTDGPDSPAALAAAAGVDQDALGRLLRVCRAMGIVCDVGDGRVGLTDRGRLLCGDGSLRAKARAGGAPWHWEAWGGLLRTVTDGRSAFAARHGGSSFDFFERTPGTGETMMNRVTAEAELRGEAIARAFDFSSVRTVVDVGGGRGAILAAVLRRHPGLRGTLLDLPYAVRGADAVLAAYGVADRCEVVAGDFRADVPPGGAVYLLSAVLHSWTDDDSVALLRRCLDHGARLLVVDEVIDVAAATMATLLKDLQLMVFSGGRLRTLGEYGELFDRAGAVLTARTPIRDTEYAMEGVRR